MPAGDVPAFADRFRPSCFGADSDFIPICGMNLQLSQDADLPRAFADQRHAVRRQIFRERSNFLRTPYQQNGYRPEEGLTFDRTPLAQSSRLTFSEKMINVSYHGDCPAEI